MQQVKLRQESMGRECGSEVRDESRREAQIQRSKTAHQKARSGRSCWRHGHCIRASKERRVTLTGIWLCIWMLQL